MATQAPQDEKEELAIKERDENMKAQYEARVIKKEGKRKLLVDNEKFETFNTIDKNGKTVSETKRVGGYKVYLND